MTREEAIETLENHTQYFVPVQDLGALNTAISALRPVSREQVEKIPTLTPPNEPLTLEELRGMNGPVWVACKPIEGGNGYWCLCRYGTITTPAETVFDAEEIPHWVFYRRPPEVSP